MSDNHKAIAHIERAEIAERMSPVVATGMAVLAQNPNPETLEKLIAMQERWEANEARKAYAAAMVGLKRDLPSIIGKDKRVAFGDTRYTHASLANIVEKIDGALSRHGFSVSWVPATTSGAVTVTCRLMHAAGHVEQNTMTAPVDSSGKKNPVQQIGSTVTYLERYTVLALLGIATADQDDADQPHANGDGAPRVHTDRNMRAVAALKKYGKTRADAESFLGKTLAGWDDADLQKLKAWLQPKSDGPTKPTGTIEADYDYGPPPMDDTPEAA